MFRVVTPPIIRAHITVITASGTFCYLPRSAIAKGSSDGRVHAVTSRTVFFEVCPVPDAVIKVTCAPDDWWSYHPKHVEQFTEI